jgi:hypothetical protein
MYHAREIPTDPHTLAAMLDTLPAQDYEDDAPEIEHRPAVIEFDRIALVVNGATVHVTRRVIRSQPKPTK